MKTYYFNDKLILDETNKKMNYIVEDKLTKEQISLTNILDNIFNSSKFNNKLVRVLGRVYNHDSIKDLNNLFSSCNSSHVEGYCIGSLQLENKLFDAVNFDVEIYLEDYTNFVFSEAMIRNEDAKSIIS